MQFNQLNDDCLIAIFDRFSMRELIHLRIICGRWCAVIKIIGGMKHTLKLFGSFRDVDDYCRALLEYDLEDDPYFKLSTSPVECDEIVGIGVNTKGSSVPNKRSAHSHLNASFNFLADLFPNIKTLIICDRYQDKSTFGPYSTSWESLVRLDLEYLLGQWTELTSLSLFMFPTKRVLLPLATTRFECLKRFEFFKTSRYFSPGADDNVGTVNYLNALSSTVWAQLDHLSIGCVAPDLAIIFSHFGTNLKHLKLYECPHEDLSFLRNKKPEIISNLTHFTVNIRGYQHLMFNTLETVCAKFKSLKSLGLVLSPTHRGSMDFVIREVANLHLSELRVCYHSNYQSNQSESHITQQIGDDVISKFQLRSIKTLKIKNSALLRGITREMPDWVSKLFPELKSLNISEHCTKTTFKKLERLDKAHRRAMNASTSIRKLECTFTLIPLKDDLSPFIGTYGKLYQQFKTDRKNNQTYRRRNNYNDNYLYRRNYNLVRFQNYGLVAHEEDDSDHDADDFPEEEEEDMTDSSDGEGVEFVEQYPVDQDGVILLD